MAENRLITKKQREEVELLIYEIMDKIDPSHTNSDYYRELFNKMDDNSFFHFFERRLPIRFHYEIFKIEPKMYDIVDAFKILDKPLFEKINLPHVYRDKDGTPIQSQECLVIYIHIKRMKQVVIDKSHVALNTEKRDMKTGILSGEDKGGRESDREFEALAAFGLDYTMDEFSRPRADSLQAASEMSSIILSKGSVSEKEITIDKADNLAKNMLNVYLLGANIYSNLVDIDYMTPRTALNKKRQIERI